jgi:DNA-binding CsgD family transcriptional regulator
MELLERASQLAELRQHLRSAAAGQGRLVLIAGEAGAGKTALVAQFCQEIGDTAWVLQASCDALSTPGPFGPLRDIAPALGGEIQELLTHGASRDQLYYTVLSVLDKHAGTTVLIGEDAHWTDQASRDLLRFLGRRVSSRRLLLIVTYRDDELGPAHPLRLTLGDLATAPALHRLTLPPLSEAGVRTLAAGSGANPETLYRLTGGNPFFVTEVLANAGQSIPASVRDAVLARAARLSPEARSVLDVAAVIGKLAEANLLTRVVGPVIAAIEECCDRGCLQPDSDALAFRHELARDAIYDAIRPLRRRLLHARVLAALREEAPTSQDTARLAHHAEAAGDREATLAFATRAAAQASALWAHREAAAQYARALRHADGVADAERAQLLEGRSFACYLSDQGEEAIAARRSALAIWRHLGERLQEGENLRWLSRLYWFAGQNAQAEEAGDAARTVLEALSPGPQLAMAYSNLSQLRMLMFDTAGAIDWGTRAIALATQSGEHETLIHALTNVGTARLNAGDEQGRAELERALRLATEAGFVDHVGRARTNLAWSALHNLDLAEAERQLDGGLAYATEYDLDNYRLYLLALRALIYRYHGAWSEALDIVQPLVLRPALSPLTRIVALTVLGSIHTRRGHPAGSAALAEALALAEQTGELQRLGPVRAARAEAAWLGGDQARILVEAGALRDLAGQFATPWLRGEIAGWLHRAGERDLATAGIAAPFARQLAGDWTGAALAWERQDCPYEAACALVESGDLAAIRQALATFEALGAAPGAALAIRRLHALGVHDIPRGPRPATRANPAGLTPREVEVLVLLTRGLRNADIAAQLFLTPKTVAHHVSAILTKLQVTSRTEAAHSARERGIVPTQSGHPVA